MSLRARTGLLGRARRQNTRQCTLQGRTRVQRKEGSPQLLWTWLEVSREFWEPGKGLPGSFRNKQPLPSMIVSQSRFLALNELKGFPKEALPELLSSPFYR